MSNADHRADFSSTDDVLVLASVSSKAETDLLNTWLQDQRHAHPDTAVAVVTFRGDTFAAQTTTALAEQLNISDDRTVIPVRVFWVPAGLPTRIHLIGWLTGRDTYRPPEFLQRRILRKDPTRARIVAGEPATVSELRQLWQENTAGQSPAEFAQFVLRRAALAIERTEYRLLGPEYKSPRLVKPEILASSQFRDGLQKIPGATIDQAGKILDELATGWSRFSVDLIPEFSRFLYRRGFDPHIDYDLAQIDVMRKALEEHPAVMLWSHRSNLDSAVLTVALQENQLPRTHVFAGINMSFAFMGPILRRSGVIFIRRSFGGDKLYKYVLKQFVGYLVEKRFNLSWSIEGTRSRTGKMLPPKLGLLSYVADAYCEGRSNDILLQPVSISFDQLHEITEYAAYARGSQKIPEGIGWLYHFIKAQGERNYGKIYVRFPEAVSMRTYLELPQEPSASQTLSAAGEKHPSDKKDTHTANTAADNEDIIHRALHKMAFEVAWRILRVTPINATSLVSALLLAAGGRAMTLSQAHHTLQDSLDYLERKNTPMTSSTLRLRDVTGVQTALDALSGGHPVTRIDSGREPVWQIAAEHELEAAFYRNSLIHAFLETSISELALVHAGRAPKGERITAFWTQAMRLRDLLKFDFYFADSTAFQQNITEEMTWQDNWTDAVAAGEDAVNALLRAKRPLMAPAMLRPFFEAYQIVADVVRDLPADIDATELTTRALGLGTQYAAQGWINSTESVSTLLFATALQVIADQNLCTPTADLAERRHAFLHELRAIVADADHIYALSLDQFNARELRLRGHAP